MTKDFTGIPVNLRFMMIASFSVFFSKFVFAGFFKYMVVICLSMIQNKTLINRFFALKKSILKSDTPDYRGV
jgi:hypothetical protein